MTQKVNTTNETIGTMIAETEAAITDHTSQDLRTAILIVSVVVNVFIFTTWVALQVTSQYDTQIASFLFNR